MTESTKVDRQTRTSCQRVKPWPYKNFNGRSCRVDGENARSPVDPVAQRLGLKCDLLARVEPPS